nr:MULTISPECIES: tyrosine-type recombinase/integrase [unclassified Frankia]
MDSDYVFVNLWAEPYGSLLTYSAVYDLVVRLRHITGILFSPHLFRHTYATWLLRNGAGMESVKELLGHASITTTVDTYGHLNSGRRPAGVARRGEFPCEVHRIGRLYRVKTSNLLHALDTAR